MGGLRHSRWRWRFAAFATAHGALIAVSIFVIMPFVMRCVDDHYPSVFFYHLEPNEEAGPFAGDVLIFFLLGELVIWLLLMVPLAFYLRIPWGSVALAALSYIPIGLLMFLGMYYFELLAGWR